MADRRMFTKKITNSDAFLEMSSATQALYFHLNQEADDDGFNNQIQAAMFRAHAGVDDLKVLLMKNFIIRFESGVIVIKHWRMHNTLRKDRYNPTNFQDELALLNVKYNGAYTLIEGNGCQVVANPVPQVRLGKDSIDKVSKEEKHKFGEFGHVRLKKSESTRLIQELGQDIFDRCIKRLDEYIQETGKKYKDHNLTIRRWVIDAVKQPGKPKAPEQPKQNKFNNHDHRDYTPEYYADLEKKLYGKGL